MGYHIHCKVIDGAHFVPQHRERIIIVGFREPVAFDWDMLNLPEKNQIKLGSMLCCPGFRSLARQNFASPQSQNLSVSTEKPLAL